MWIQLALEEERKRKVKCKEALDLLVQVTGQMQATRQVHDAIAEALRTLAAATVTETVKEPVDDGLRSPA